MNTNRQLQSLRDIAFKLCLDEATVRHAESGVRGDLITQALDFPQIVAPECSGPLTLSDKVRRQDRYSFRRPLLERGLKAFMMQFICTGSNSNDVIAEPWRTFGFSFSAAAAGCHAPTTEQEGELEGTGHSFIYGDRNAMMLLARLVAVPVVKYLSNLSAHGWVQANSYGDPLEALGDWAYIIYEVGLKTGDPSLRRYYRFLVPFRAGECPTITDDTLLPFDGRSGIAKSAFNRPKLWKLLWQAANQRELAFSKLGTDLVLASRTALDHLLDMDVAFASSTAFGEGLAEKAMASTGPAYAFEWSGDFWHLTFEGKTTHIRDGIGPRYIALLLANPIEEVFCPDIIAIANGNPILKMSQTKDVLADDQTIRECKQRLQELDEELQEAKEFNEWGKQEKLQEKVDSLEDHLLKLSGLRNKTRTFSDSFNNARTSVTNAINRTLRSNAVKPCLPEAYRHLDKAISRGTFMSYNPEKTIDWVLSTEKSSLLHAL